MRKRKRDLWFYRFRHTYRGGWFVLLKDHDPEWEYVLAEPVER